MSTLTVSTGNLNELLQSEKPSMMPPKRTLIRVMIGLAAWSIGAGHLGATLDPGIACGWLKTATRLTRPFGDPNSRGGSAKTVSIV